MDEVLINTISSHITKHLGEPTEVMHELIPTDGVHVDMHVVKPTDDRRFYTVVTSGMSELAMTIPEELEGQVTPYVELMLCLPPDWRMDQLQSPRWNWPIKWLQLLAKYPHEYDAFLYVGHTIPNDDPPQPFGPNTKQCCWFVGLPSTVPEAFLELEYEGRTILFLGLTAIYQSEMDFALSRDPESRYELDQALEKAGVTELIAPNRPAVR